MTKTNQIRQNPGLLGEIVYLDTAAVGDLLAAIEGGMFVERTDTSRADTSVRSELRAVLGPVEGGINAGRSGGTQRQVSFRSTPVGELSRLCAYLDERRLLGAVLGSDAESWAQLREGEFIECRSDVRVSPFHAFLERAEELITTFSELTAFMPSSKVEEMKQVRAQVAQLLAAFGAQKALPVIFEPSDAEPSARRFFGFLRTADAFLRRPSLEGPAMVLGRIRHVLEGTEKVDFLTVGGISMPRQITRDLMKSMSGNPFGTAVRLSDLKAVSPAVELQVLAVVR